jgi:hypothetical protein
MYVYLSVNPRWCDIADCPDGSRVVLSRGGGEAFALAWDARGGSGPAVESVPTSETQRRVRERAAHRGWSARLETALEASTSISHGRMIREAFLAENPEPAVDGPASDAAHSETVRVSPGRWWCARLEDGPESFEAWLGDAEDGYPRTAVAHALSELCERGWEVRHVSEERRAVHEGESSRAEVIGAWFLLRSG